jgi:adenylylsulfate kinase
VSWAIWITGLPGSGKSALTRAVARALREEGERPVVLELDRLRRVLTPAPTYQAAERELVYRVLVYLAAVITESGIPVLIDATGHRRAWRDLARAVIPVFGEVQLTCPLTVCRERERGRVAGAAPAGIYARAGRPGATVPGVDVEYEPAVAPEVTVDTEHTRVEDAVDDVVGLARQLAREVPDVARGEERAWALWVTGLPGSGKTTLACAVAEALAARGVAVRRLDVADLRDFAGAGRPTTVSDEEILHRAVACAAGLLTGAGVPVVIDATGPRRAWRQLARQMVPHFAEVQLLCPPPVCVERERAVRWNLGVCAPGVRPVRATAAPDIVLDYEPSLAPEATLRTDVLDVGTAAREVLRLAESLDRAAARAHHRHRKETSMQVRDLMTRTLITVTPDTSVTEARALMTKERIRHLLVTENDRLVGLITDRDVRLSLPSPATSLSVWELNYLLARLTVRETMTKAVITVDPDRDARDAARIMLDHKIGALPVLEGTRLVGIVTETDLVRAFAESGDRAPGMASARA